MSHTEATRIEFCPHPTFPPTLGARYLGDRRCLFRVWAPKVDRLELKLVTPQERVLAMQPCDGGYYQLYLEDIAPGTQYFYRLNNERDRPDPASRFQPEGVHRPSAVVDPQYAWTDAHWSGIPLHEYITYELHVGTFTLQGTFEAAIEYLDDLCDLGVTAVELMPVAQFPGGRNWGYDGVHPFAVQNTYGGPAGLKRLVDACHARNLAVVMDVVYNHIGPEGNYLGEFGHYFTNRHRTPWGEAINFDAPHSDDVCRYFIENALYWIDEFHIDALRLDAVHAIYDFSARPFLQELASAVRTEGERLNRRVYTVAESSLNDARLVTPTGQGGIGIDAQWCDDLHHSLRTLLTGERTGYYADFHGFDDLVKTFRENWALDGGYSIYRGRRHGNSARNLEPLQLVVCSQNHDQVGNRMLGERLTELISFEQSKLAAAVVLLSPFQPMLFMGEEYGETARFQYFISHQDEQLIEAVRRGRNEEFARFRWSQAPPDPQDEATFERCKLNHALKQEEQHRVLRNFYKALVHLRKTEPALALPRRDRMEVSVLQPGRVMAVESLAHDRTVLTIFHFGSEPATTTVPMAAGQWSKMLDSAQSRWQGPGSSLPENIESSGETTLSLAPNCVVVYGK